MVVVVIIAIMAVIAVPLFSARFRAQRVQQVAGRVADLYRGSRTRALARGAATLVTLNVGSATTLQVLEGVQGTTAAKTNCANLPTQGCLTNNWGNVGTSTAVGTARVIEGISQQNVTTSVTLPGSSAMTAGSVALCFSPGGRTFVNTAGVWSAENWTPLTNVALITVSDPSNSPRTYNVLIMPNGTARLEATRTP
jgi:Tfp pilus assembly protein FimT